MKRKLSLALVSPLTIILFILFNKCWIVDVVDGTDGIMCIPFIYKSPAFYTSMAVEYFITELIVDFVIICGIVCLINKFIFEIKIRKIVSVILFIIALTLTSFELLLACMPENKFSIKRDFDIE